MGIKRGGRRGERKEEGSMPQACPSDSDFAQIPFCTLEPQKTERTPTLPRTSSRTFPKGVLLPTEDLRIKRDLIVLN